MAMRGEKKHYRLAEIQRRHFNETASSSGIGKNAEPIIHDILLRTPGVLAAAQREIPKGFPQNIAEPILSGLARSAKKLERMAP